VCTADDEIIQYQTDLDQEGDHSTFIHPSIYINLLSQTHTRPIIRHPYTLNTIVDDQLAKTS
jgi:hypothetical protein